MNRIVFCHALALSFSAVALSACSSTSDSAEDASTPTSDATTTSTEDGAIAADGAIALDDSGTAATSDSSSTTADSGATLGAGKAYITATFSNPVDGYNGVSDPYTSASDFSNAALEKKGVAFSTGDNKSPVARTVAVNVGDVAPVAGMAYPIVASGDDLIKGNQISYQALDVATVTSKSWFCDGSVTFDTVAGKAYTFHFTGVCKVYGGGAKGGITITGTGAGTLP